MAGFPRFAPTAVPREAPFDGAGVGAAFFFAVTFAGALAAGTGFELPPFAPRCTTAATRLPGPFATADFAAGFATAWAFFAATGFAATAFLDGPAFGDGTGFLDGTAFFWAAAVFVIADFGAGAWDFFAGTGELLAGRTGFAGAAGFTLPAVGFALVAVGFAGGTTDFPAAALASFLVGSAAFAVVFPDGEEADGFTFASPLDFSSASGATAFSRWGAFRGGVPTGANGALPFRFAGFESASAVGLEDEVGFATAAWALEPEVAACVAGGLAGAAAAGVAAFPTATFAVVSAGRGIPSNPSAATGSGAGASPGKTAGWLNGTLGGGTSRSACCTARWNAGSSSS